MGTIASFSEPRGTRVLWADTGMRLRLYVSKGLIELLWPCSMKAQTRQASFEEKSAG